MNKFNQLKRGKVIAIKNFDEGLYRYVKAYASLEGRTVTSVFEEAVRQWMQGRGNQREVSVWVSLEEAYKKNERALERMMEELVSKEGYAVVCEGNLMGIYGNYEEALMHSRKKCSIQALIIKLPPPNKERVLELGLPW